MKRLVTVISLITSIYMKAQLADEKHFPVFFFKEFSTAFDTLYSYQSNRENNISDTLQILKIMIDYAKENSNLKIVIIGHSDFREKSKKRNISLERVIKIKKLLMDNGIPEKNIISRPKGDTAPFITQNQIAKAKTVSEKDLLRRYNRKVSFQFEK